MSSDRERDVGLEGTTPQGAPRASGAADGVDDTSDPFAATADASAPSPATNDEDAHLGDHLGRYLIRGRLGAGGMGVVYRARDPALDRDLAIKVVRTRAIGEEAQARLLREAQTMAKLRHPAIVPVFDVGTVGTNLFVVMPYLEGGTLGGWLRARPRSWREVLARFVSAGRGLAAAHGAGLVHRDFKPDNVLLGAGGEVQVADFGLARLVGDGRAGSSAVDAAVDSAVDSTLGAVAGSAPALTETGAILGTPAYMPPEQLRGEPVDARADLFSFCVAVYEGLYGERPFVLAGGDGDRRFGELLEAIEQGRLAAPAPGRDVPAWLRAAVLRGLRARPEQRWPSITALLDHLEARQRRPRRLLAGGVAVAVVGGLVAMAVGITRAPPRRSPTAMPSWKMQMVTSRGDFSAAALAPDGHHLLALGATDLLLLDLDEPDQQTVLATDVAARATDLSWSPDGRTVGYWRLQDHTPVWATLDVATRTIKAVTSGAQLFITSEELLQWKHGADDRFEIVSAADRAAKPRICVLPGEPGRLGWIDSAVTTATGGIFVVTSASAESPPDRVYYTDRTCAKVEIVARDLELQSVAPSAHGEMLVALQRTENVTNVIEIDARGEIHPRFDAIDVSAVQIAGIRDTGSAIVLQMKQSWQLLRARATRPAVEITSGSHLGMISLAPDGLRAALIEGGALRILTLADARARGAPLEPSAGSAAWSPDGHEVAVLLARDDRTVLVVEDADGAHRIEIPIAGAEGSTLLWLDADDIAFLRSDLHTYTVVNRRTKAARELVDPAIGWVGQAARSPIDGRLAMVWNRQAPGPGLYLIPPVGDPELLIAGSDIEYVTWSPDGRALYFSRSTASVVESVDVATHVASPYLTLGGGSTYITALIAAPDGDLLVMQVRPVVDLVAITSQP